VISLLLPNRQRNALAAVYAFARTADDIADEGSLSREERHHRLEELRAKLESTYNGDPPSENIFIALYDTITKFKIPPLFFIDLLRAFHMDVEHQQPRCFDDLLLYSRLSANPVGRIVLRVFGYEDSELDNLSDNICTALQLTNFWQDVFVDLQRNRIYLPAEDMEATGYGLEELRLQKINERFQHLLALEVHRTEHLFEMGKPLLHKIHGLLRFHVSAIFYSGEKVLLLIRDSQYNVLERRPRLRKSNMLRLLPKILLSPTRERYG